MIGQSEIKKLMRIKGEARGAHFRNDADFVLREKGKQGLAMVEKELAEMDHPIKYKEIDQFNFYPVGLRALSLLAIKKAFNWPDEKIRELGSFAVKRSWIIKILIGYFVSIEKTLREAHKFWSKYFTVGKLEIVESSPDKKRIILKIKDFDLHPLYCHCLEGVFSELARMMVKSERITCQETECSFRGGGGHYYLIKW